MYGLLERRVFRTHVEEVGVLLDAGIEGATQSTNYSAVESEEIWLDEGPLCGIHGATQTTQHIVDSEEIWLDDGPHCPLHGRISQAGGVDEIYLDEGPKCCIHGCDLLRS